MVFYPQIVFENNESRTSLRAETPACTECFGEGGFFGVQARTRKMGGRLAVGLWTLAPSTEVRILAPQPSLLFVFRYLQLAGRYEQPMNGFSSDDIL
jgi:hypothetical protein